MKRAYTIVFLLFLRLSIIYAQDQLETVVQKGHNEAVKSIDVSKDGRFAITGSRDKSAKLWDLTTGREIRSFLGHSYTINSVQFSPDTKYLATTSSDKTAKIWSVLTGKELFSTLPDEKFQTDVAFSPDGQNIICGGYGDSATIYKVNTWEIVVKLAVNSDQGSGIGTNFEFSPDGHWLAIGEDNRTMKLYDTKTWQLAKTITPAEGWCGGCGTFVAFSPDSRFILKLSNNSKLEKYEVSTGKLVFSADTLFDNAISCAYRPDGKSIMAANKSSIYIWDDASGKLLKSFKDLPTQNEVIYNTDGTALLVASDNNTARLVEISDGSTKRSLTGILNDVDKGGINYDRENYWDSYIAQYISLKNNLLISPDGKSFIKGKSGTRARKWDIVTGAPLYDYQGHEKAVICFDYSPDGKYLVTGDGAGTSIIWDTKSQKIIRKVSHHTQPIFDIKFSPDGSNIISSSWDLTVAIWETSSGKSLSKIDLQTFQKYSVYSISYTPDGLYIVMANLNKSLELWEPDSKSVVRTFLGHTDVVSSISFSPDKKQMLTSSWDGTARLWDIPSGLMLAKFVGSNGGLNASLFSPDGTKVITGGNDRLIRIYERSSGRLLSTLAGHQAGISSISISADGQTLISASLDGIVKIWDFPKGKEFYEHIHIGTKDWMAKTNDGYFNATEGARTSIHFVKGLESFSANQFFEKFYRPELLPQLFRKRGERNLQGINETINKFPPPTCKIAALPMEGSLQASLFLKVINQGGGIEDIKLLHNGKRIQLSVKNIPDSKKGEEVIVVDTLDLVGGPNIFSLSAYSQERVESSTSEVKIVSSSKETNATCHIMAVGIDKYKNSALTLSYAKADAESIVNSFTKNGGNIFKEVKVHSLYNEKATKQNILDTLERLSKMVRHHDVFIFFYAGHGSMVEGKFYFIPTECTMLYESAELNKKALEASMVQEKFKEIKALKQIIVMDACHSGGSVELLANRGSSEEKAIAQLSRSAGIHVLASTGSEQTAKELKDLGHGLFTSVLIEALSGAADGAPQDGKVTVYEIKSYLDDQVPLLNQKYSGKPQYPYTFSRGHDFPLIFKE